MSREIHDECGAQYWDHGPHMGCPSPERARAYAGYMERTYGDLILSHSELAVAQAAFYEGYDIAMQDKHAEVVRQEN